jgi:hypothetical protein
VLSGRGLIVGLITRPEESYRVWLCLSVIVKPHGEGLGLQELSSHDKISKTNMADHLNPLNPELNPICYLLALLAHHFLHVSRIRVKSLTLRVLTSYIYGVHILDEPYRLWCVVVCDLETSRICTPYIYDVSTLRIKDTMMVSGKRV